MIFGSSCAFASDVDKMLNPGGTGQMGVVEKVVSAESLTLKDGRKIHLIGLNAPQTPRNRDIKRDSYGYVIKEVNPATTLEERAYDFAKSLLETKTIRLEYDITAKDEHFQTLAYVFLPDGTFANAAILRQGYANLKIILPNTKYEVQLRAAYQEARREKRGLQGE